MRFSNILLHIAFIAGFLASGQEVTETGVIILSISTLLSDSSHSHHHSSNTTIGESSQIVSSGSSLVYGTGISDHHRHHTSQSASTSSSNSSSRHHHHHHHKTHPIGEQNSSLAAVTSTSAVYPTPLTASVEVLLANTPVFVGALTGTALYTSVSSALDALCPTVTNSSDPITCGADPVTIESVPYFGSAGASHGELVVQVVQSGYKETSLRDALVKSIALAANTSATNTNCVNDENYPLQEQCNAVQSVRANYYVPVQVKDQLSGQGITDFISSNFTFDASSQPPINRELSCNFTQDLNTALLAIESNFTYPGVAWGGAITASCISSIINNASITTSLQNSTTSLSTFTTHSTSISCSLTYQLPDELTPNSWYCACSGGLDLPWMFVPTPTPIDKGCDYTSIPTSLGPGWIITGSTGPPHSTATSKTPTPTVSTVSSPIQLQESAESHSTITRPRPAWSAPVPWRDSPAPKTTLG